MAKMTKKWVVLCTAALGAIYATEYFTTDAQASLPQVPGYSQANVQSDDGSAAGSLSGISSVGTLDQSGSAGTGSVPTGSGDTGSVASGHPGTSDPGTSETAPSRTTASPSRPAPSPSPVLNKVYKDGTFKGVGSNRRGYIEVTVKTKNDKITDVEISDFAMHYSESDVVGLPDEVLQKQSARVDNVSGATYSTRAFEDAVQQALSQAKIG